MPRLIAVLALAGSLAGCASSPFSSAPAAQVAPTTNQTTQSGVAGTKYDCVTEEGIGRTLPCGYANY
jgi:PBP1b-binding outer membrane lipoprotein LpoB